MSCTSIRPSVSLCSVHITVKNEHDVVRSLPCMPHNSTTQSGSFGGYSDNQYIGHWPGWPSNGASADGRHIAIALLGQSGYYQISTRFRIII